MPLPHPMELARDWGLTPHAAIHLSALLAVHSGLTVTSGRRSPERNSLVGGVPDSFHLEGRAVDVVGPRAAMVAAARTAHAQRVTEGCTGPEEVIDEGDHLHLAW